MVKETLRGKIEKANLIVVGGLSQSVSEPPVLVLNIIEPLIKSESFRKWFRGKKEDMKLGIDFIKRANSAIKAEYFVGKVVGYGAYPFIGYAIYEIIKSFN